MAGQGAQALPTARSESCPPRQQAPLMARFFLPPLQRAGANAERAYRDLRAQAEAVTGSVSRDRRIQGIECRRRGLDCRLSVGEADEVNGRTVAAIVQLR